MENEQMTEGQETQAFLDAWNSHIENFERLRFSLNEKNFEKLDSVLNELRQLVETAGVERAFKKAKREEGGNF